MSAEEPQKKAAGKWIEKMKGNDWVQAIAESEAYSSVLLKLMMFHKFRL